MLDTVKKELEEAMATPEKDRTQRQWILVKRYQTSKSGFDYVAQPPDNSEYYASSRGGNFKERADAMRRNPDLWMVLARGLKRDRAWERCRVIRQGKRKGTAPAGTFNACVAKSADGTYTVFARYVGNRKSTIRS